MSLYLMIYFVSCLDGYTTTINNHDLTQADVETALTIFDKDSTLVVQDHDKCYVAEALWEPEQ